MLLRTRRIVYLAFIFIFLIVTPVVIFYATGYRYNFEKHKLQKTGIMILKSKPEGAEVFLNNKPKNVLTPARIGNLLPDDYVVRVEKDGFYPWQKILPVESRLTTFAENILLFQKSLPAEIIDGQIDLFSLSPTKQKIVYLETRETGDEIWLFSLRTSEKKMLYRLSAKDGEKINLEWSRDGQKILIILGDAVSQNKKFVVLNTENDEASVYQNLGDFYLSFRGIGGQEIGVDEQSRFLFVDSPSNFLTTIDKGNQSLTVRDAQSGEIILDKKANSAVWADDGKKLLYNNNFELWVHDFTADQEKLISRYSQKIKKSLWINNNYVAVLIDNTLKVIELDERDRRNVVDLVILEATDGFDVDQTKQKIYFITTIGNKKGVYELQY